MFNLHTHTYRCHHAKGTDEEYVIKAIENGGSVSLEVLLDLCDALKITPDYLLLGTIRDTPSEDFIDLIKLCDDYEISILYDTANSLINNRNNR